jgi:hypothetical protein
MTTLQTVTLNHEKLMQMYRMAKARGLPAIDQWAAILDEYLRASDNALRMAREGMREGIDQRERDCKRIAFLEEFGRHPFMPRPAGATETTCDDCGLALEDVLHNMPAPAEEFAE